VAVPDAHPHRYRHTDAGPDLDLRSDPRSDLDAGSDLHAGSDLDADPGSDLRSDLDAGSGRAVGGAAGRQLPRHVEHLQ
jgi:hypothetical protein